MIIWEDKIGGGWKFGWSHRNCPRGEGAIWRVGDGTATCYECCKNISTLTNHFRTQARRH